MRTSSPVSSVTSRSAVCSTVSTPSGVPLGSVQLDPSRSRRRLPRQISRPVVSLAENHPTTRGCAGGACPRAVASCCLLLGQPRHGAALRGRGRCGTPCGPVRPGDRSRLGGVTCRLVEVVRPSEPTRGTVDGDHGRGGPAARRMAGRVGCAVARRRPRCGSRRIADSRREAGRRAITPDDGLAIAHRFEW